MYEVSGDTGLTATSFDPGTSLLVTGERHATHALVVDLLADGVEASETSILVTTNSGASSGVEAFERRGTLAPERVGIIDCTARESNEAETDVPVRYLGSPGDLTGISLEFAKLVKGLGDANGLRVGVSTVSTILMYADAETVFRFLHVFTSRIRSGGWFGTFSLDPDMHDPQTVNTIRAVFDSEARITDDGVELRGEGFD